MRAAEEGGGRASKPLILFSPVRDSDCFPIFIPDDDPRYVKEIAMWVLFKCIPMTMAPWC